MLTQQNIRLFFSTTSFAHFVTEQRTLMSRRFEHTSICLLYDQLNKVRVQPR